MEEFSSLLNIQELNKEQIIRLLSTESPLEIEQLRQKANELTLKNCGEKVYLRGLIEFSNYCVNDCFYCGIRKSNNKILRYFLTEDEILECAHLAFKLGFGSIVLQSGERRDSKFIDFLCRTIEKIKLETKSEILPNGLGITLCVGKQSLETYRKFFEAGAHRYLLRIETTNKELFKEIHPKDISFDHQVECLYAIKEVGFQLGTGVMIGLPNQTLKDLADDLIFFRKIDADMIGMGPYIVHKNTPMQKYSNYFVENKNKIYQLALKMISVARIFLKNVNIASTTALQALYPFGREEGLRYGANVIMPLLTPTKFRKEYLLYDGKPCIDEFANDCYDCIIHRIESIGRKVGHNEYGDSPHFLAKVSKNTPGKK
ncbi:MAG: [FeFe] hydrogenase H-cluster radical SAM maturase HydE [Candidatus Kapaibacteriales bacterium]